MQPKYSAIALIVLLFLTAPTVGAINCKDPETTPGDGRTVKQNYLELVYDAQNGELEWHRHFRNKSTGGKVTDNSIVIPQDTVFPPFAYTKERIIVKVCNAKFDAELSASTSVTQIPESGPDIHGLQQNATAATPATQTTSSSLLTSTVVDTSVSNAVDNLLTKQPNGQKLALQYLRTVTKIYDKDFNKIASDIALLNCGGSNPPADCNVDSVQYIAEIARHLGEDVTARKNSTDAFTNTGAFELLATRTTSLVSSLNNLGTALAAATLPDRIAKLLADSQTIASAINSATTNESSKKGELQTAKDQYTKADQALRAALAKNNPTEIEQTTRGKDEALAKVNSVKEEYQDAVALKNFATDSEKTLETDDPSILVKQTISLDADLNSLHHQASTIFQTMNILHDGSMQVVATVLQPQSTNAVISVSIILHDTYSPFGFAPVASNMSPSTKTPPPGNAPAQGGGDKGQTKQSSPSGTPSGSNIQQNSPAVSEQHVVRRVLIEVHRRSDFNIVGGFSASSIRQTAFSLHEVSATNTNLVVFESQNDRFQLQALAGLNIYLKKRDLFPGYLTPAMRWIPGILFGTSVTSLGNFMIGPNWEPITGLDLYSGLAVGHTTDLLKGVVPGVTQFDPKTTSAPTVQTLRTGLFFGIGFDLNTFRSVFQKSSSQ
jgi:hypothetical protein